MQMISMEDKELSQDTCVMILQKYWPPRLADGVRSMKALKSGQGVVFDIYED